MLSAVAVGQVWFLGKCIGCAGGELSWERDQKIITWKEIRVKVMRPWTLVAKLRIVEKGQHDI